MIARRALRAWGAGLAGAAALFCLAGDARAEFVPQYFFFDQAVWSADSRQIVIAGRYRNDTTREALGDTLRYDLLQGRLTCASPSMNEFCLSRDRRRMLGLGRWGLYDHDLARATTREVRYQDPLGTNPIATYGYSKEVDAVVAIRCDPSDPDSSGVWSYPLDGGAPRQLFPDPECGPQSLNYWQLRRRSVAPTEPNVPSSDRPTEIPGTDATVLQVNERSLTSVILRQAGRDTVICTQCRPEFVSWPKEGGVGLVGTSPANRLDRMGPGALWLLRAGQPPKKLLDGRADLAVWSDSVTAYTTLRPGRVLVVDAGAGRADGLNLSMVPEWARRSLPPAAEVWTIRLGSTVWADFEAVRAEARRYREAAGTTGFAADRVAGGEGYLMSVGAWPDSAAAARQLAAVRKTLATGPGAGGAPPECRVTRRPASTMQGSFDFGSLLSPDGKWRLYYRTHPHMFLPYLSNEVWLEPAGGGKRRLIVAAMASF